MTRREIALVGLSVLAVSAWAVAVMTGWLLWASLAFGWTLVALATVDLRSQLLPDALTLPLIPSGLAVAYAVDPASLADHAIAAAVGYAGFAALRWAHMRIRRREGLGLGDCKFLAGAGAWVAWPGLPSVVLIAAVGALAVVLPRALAGHRILPDRRMAFGPYLCLGAWIVWLHGPLIIAL